MGETWTDLSGFGEQSSESSNGFPDVFTHSLLVMPFDTNIIWVGTEIGLFESLDGGASWNIRNDFPAASIWSMKNVDDQVVMGTHGRGIWTATIEELKPTLLSVASFEYSGYGKASVIASLPVAYENVELFINGKSLLIDENPVLGDNAYNLTGFNNFSGGQLKIVGIFEGSEYSNALTIDNIDLAPAVLDFSSTFDGEISDVTIELENNEPFDKIEVYFNGTLVHTDAQALTEAEASRLINFTYSEQAANAVELRAYIGDMTFSTNINRLVTATESALQTKVRIYPNPVVNQLNIADETNILVNAKIYQLNGTLVKKVKFNSAGKLLVVNVSSLKEGIYLLQLESKDGAIRTKRFIKE